SGIPIAPPKIGMSPTPLHAQRRYARQVAYTTTGIMWSRTSLLLLAWGELRAFLRRIATATINVVSRARTESVRTITDNPESDGCNSRRPASNKLDATISVKSRERVNMKPGYKEKVKPQSACRPAFIANAPPIHAIAQRPI